MQHAALVPMNLAAWWVKAFGFVDRHLSNDWLGRREYSRCSFCCAEYLAAGLPEREHWGQEEGKLWVGQGLTELQHISQVP